MDIAIKCQLSLSKKLRALVQEGETRITLVASNITNGRGEAKLVVSSDKEINKSITDFLGRETSIMLTPIEMIDVSFDNNTVGSIFAKTSKNKEIVRTAVDKIAAIEIPEKSEEAYAIKTKEEIIEEIPEEFKEVRRPDFKRFINTIEELDAAIKIAKNKISDIDVNQYQDPRKRAEAMELKEKLEAIDVNAYIVNDKCADLTINDLGINLILNMPYNLANVSAKRLLLSRQLREVINSGLVKFIKPEEISLYIQKVEQEIEKPGLDVYSSPEEAILKQMEQSEINVEKINISVDELSRPTDNEILLTNLTARSAVRTEGITKTIHGNSSPRSSKITIQDQQENSKGIKTVKRT